MEHESAVDLLVEYVAGTLDPEARVEVEAHVRECEECRDLVAAYRAAREAMEADDDHPTSEEIVTFVCREDELRAEDRTAIESHLHSCEVCREQVAAVRASEGEVTSLGEEPATTPVPGRWVWRTPGWGAALAAGILMALLLYPAYLGIFRLPEAARQVDDARQRNRDLEEQVSARERGRSAATDEAERLGSWSGPVRLEYVTGARRGQAERAPIPLSGPYVLLGVDMGVPDDIGDERTLRFEIAVDGEREPVVLTVGAGEVRRQIRESGVVALVIAAASLQPGSATLTVGLEGEPGVASFLEFEIEFAAAPDPK
jgi:anti-sigma factor RsiW